MQDVIIVGAGASGCFAAVLMGQMNKSLTISILEKTKQPLAKVRVSGGGRCNVTHHLFDVPSLVQNYPRGEAFLRGAFHRFQPQDMIDWLEKEGVELKVERDGRMFPKTNTSQTIIDLFLNLLKKQNTPLITGKEVVKLTRIPEGWEITLKDETCLQSKKVVFATGGATRAYPILEELGHKIEKAVPSLFTFELKEEWVKELSGSVAQAAHVSIKGTKFVFQGPLLITHWGMSGPAILKLSAFAAKWLCERGYKGDLEVNWVGEKNEDKIKEGIYFAKKTFSGKQVLLTPLFSLSKNLWRSLLLQINRGLEKKTFMTLSREEINQIARGLHKMTFSIIGKSLNKEEFVTAGGVNLDEVFPKTMESRKAPGIFFVGEVLNIDGITGGFNFQNAWTSAFIAAKEIASGSK
jgi:predicted Rossmann fold flavoprotein